MTSYVNSWGNSDQTVTDNPGALCFERFGTMLGSSGHLHGCKRGKTVVFFVSGGNALKLHLVLFLERAHGKICVCFVAYSVLETDRQWH